MRLKLIQHNNFNSFNFEAELTQAACDPYQRVIKYLNKYFDQTCDDNNDVRPLG